MRSCTDPATGDSRGTRRVGPGAGGTIWVGIGHTDKHAVAISIRDEGAGLPADFDPATSRGLGARLIAALSEQFDAKLTRSSADGQGTSFTLLVPLALDSGGNAKS